MSICWSNGGRGAVSLSETGPKQAQKTQPVNGDGQFSKKYGPDPLPPPNQYISEKPSSRAFRIYPTYPPLWDTQRAQMRQQRHQPLKMLRVGRIGTVPERYTYMYTDTDTNISGLPERGAGVVLKAQGVGASNPSSKAAFQIPTKI